MKYLITNLALVICSIGASGTGVDQAKQQTVLTADPNLPIPRLSFDANGDLKITASSTSSPNDFDFLVGKWKMHNRRLNKRLENCKDWTEFVSGQGSVAGCALAVERHGAWTSATSCAM